MKPNTETKQFVFMPQELDAMRLPEKPLRYPFSAASWLMDHVIACRSSIIEAGMSRATTDSETLNRLAKSVAALVLITEVFNELLPHVVLPPDDEMIRDFLGPQ